MEAKASRVVLLAFMLAATVGAADARLPKTNRRVRMKASHQGPEWREGMFNQLRIDRPCYVVNLFKARDSATAAIELESNVNLQDVVDLEVFTGVARPLREWAGRPPDTAPHHWRAVGKEAMQAGVKACATVPASSH